jgi:hypothetical protein
MTDESTTLPRDPWTAGPHSGWPEAPTTVDDRAAESQSKLIGFDVLATDGSIGEVCEESTAVGSSHIVVDTGFWIFDQKRLIPAGAIERVDTDQRTIQLQMTKQQIEDAPEFVTESVVDQTKREQIGSYYSPWIAGP